MVGRGEKRRVIPLGNERRQLVQADIKRRGTCECISVVIE